MKVLHIWEISGVASTLQKHLAPLGVDCKVMCSDKGDPYGFAANHINHSKPVTAAIIAAEARKYDVLHIHFHDEFLPLLRGLYPSKPMVMHYHGSDIRGRDRAKYLRHADAILYSTRDLAEYLPPEAEYFPNPIDTNIFTPAEKRPDHEYAIHFSYEADDLATGIAEKRNIPIIIIKQKIPHSEMPALLRNYTHLIEVKRKNGHLIMGHVNDTGSLLSLEALACGLSVLCLDGERVGLPPEHRASVAAERAAQLYEEITK